MKGMMLRVEDQMAVGPSQDEGDTLSLPSKQKVCSWKNSESGAVKMETDSGMTQKFVGPIFS